MLSNYLSVSQFQLKLEILCDNKKDILVVSKEYYEQMERSIEIIKSLQPDISIFPEMAYQGKYDNIFKELSSNGKMIVFGSTYVDSVNKTKIFFDGELKDVVKRYPCGSEPMVRFCEKIDTEEFITNYLSEHEFYVKGQKIYVLNCLEYYQVAYMIARDTSLSSDLFAFIVPCSNSNPTVFIDESRAIHNHNESIYSFVCNRVKKDGNHGYGNSYIFGPIQYHEKDWLAEEGFMCEKHNASILTLDKCTPQYAYGEYAIGSTISRFGRSDSYINTPKNIKIGSLLD